MQCKSLLIKFLSAVCALIFLSCGKASATRETVISEKQAVQLAEKFIAANGYTNAPPTVKQLNPELFSSEFEVECKLRHNSLSPRAFGVGSANFEHQGGWIVIFVSPSKEDEANRHATMKRLKETDASGRAVTMDRFGKHLRIQHKDFCLWAVAKRL